MCFVATTLGSIDIKRRARWHRSFQWAVWRTLLPEGRDPGLGQGRAQRKHFIDVLNIFLYSLDSVHLSRAEDCQAYRTDPLAGRAGAWEMNPGFIQARCEPSGSHTTTAITPQRPGIPTRPALSLPVCFPVHLTLPLRLGPARVPLLHEVLLTPGTAGSQLFSHFGCDGTPRSGS